MEQQIRPFWMARMANDTDGASFRMSLVVAFTHLGLISVDDSIKPIGVPQIVKQMGVIISSSVCKNVEKGTFSNVLKATQKTSSFTREMHEALLKIVRRQIIIVTLPRLISRKFYPSPYCNLENWCLYFQEEYIGLYSPNL